MGSVSSTSNVWCRSPRCSDSCSAQTSGPQTEQLKQAASDNGISVMPVTETLPEGKDYISWMTTNIDALQSALTK
jgi:hypothetical protein